MDIIGNLTIFLLETTGSIHGTYRGTLTANQQRKLFGQKVFGRVAVTINGAAETVYAQRSLCFGLDHESRRVSWLLLERELQAGKHPFALGRCW